MAEATNEELDAAGEGEGEAAPASGGLRRWIIIAAVAVVAAAGGVFAYPAIMNMLNPPAETEVAEEEASTPDRPALFAPLHPPLVINFTDAYGDSRFMQMTLEVMARDQGVIDEVKNHAAVIRNALILRFSSVDYERVTTREGKQQMLDDALEEIRTIIETETGETGVEAVYFTGLIIQ